MNRKRIERRIVAIEAFKLAVNSPLTDLVVDAHGRLRLRDSSTKGNTAGFSQPPVTLKPEPSRKTAS